MNARQQAWMLPSTLMVSGELYMSASGAHVSWVMHYRQELHKVHITSAGSLFWSQHIYSECWLIEMCLLEYMYIILRLQGSFWHSTWTMTYKNEPTREHVPWFLDKRQELTTVPAPWVFHCKCLVCKVKRPMNSWLQAWDSHSSSEMGAGLLF